MEMKWSPKELGDLFCDKRDSYGLYYWMECIKDKEKWFKAKTGTSIEMCYKQL